MGLSATFFTLGKITLIIAIAESVLLMAVLNERVQFLAVKPLVFLGNRSYSVYVIHQNLGFLFIYYVSAVCGYHLWISVICLILMLGIGFLLHEFVDKLITAGEATTKALIGEFLVELKIRYKK